MSHPTILDVMTHPEGLGPYFQGDTWEPWKAFLAALFGLSMTEEQAALYRLHTGRTELPTEPSVEAALICGRRAGKSRILALIAVYLGTLRDYAPYLAPGEVATVVVIASSKLQARTIFRYVVGMLQAVPSLAAMMETAPQAEAVQLTNRVAIEVGVASIRTTRGYTFAAVLADETAFWRTEETSANPDTEILDAIRPGLTTIPGAMLLLASSPYAKRGALYQAFRDNYGRDEAEVLVWKAATRDMNPSVPAAYIAKQYEKDAAWAAAEFGGEFRNDVAAFVGREVVEAAVVPGRIETLPVAGVRYSAFVDPSGGSADSFTLAIAHEREGVAVLDAVREVRPPFSPEGVVRDFAALLGTYGITRVVGDRYAGEWVREPFRKHGVTYDLSDQPKSDIYRDCLPLLNSGGVELLDLPRLVAQFCGLERRTARGGRDSIDHGPGGHDDLVNAVAGVLLRVKAGRKRVVISEAALARSQLQTRSRMTFPSRRGY